MKFQLADNSTKLIGPGDIVFLVERYAGLATQQHVEPWVMERETPGTVWLRHPRSGRAKVVRRTASNLFFPDRSSALMLFRRKAQDALCLAREALKEIDLTLDHLEKPGAHCLQCGHLMREDSAGVGHHLTKDGGIDYDQDTAHMAVAPRASDGGHHE